MAMADIPSMFAFLKGGTFPFTLNCGISNLHVFLTRTDERLKPKAKQDFEQRNRDYFLLLVSLDLWGGNFNFC